MPKTAPSTCAIPAGNLPLRRFGRPRLRRFVPGTKHEILLWDKSPHPPTPGEGPLNVRRAWRAFVEKPGREFIFAPVAQAGLWRLGASCVLAGVAGVPRGAKAWTFRQGAPLALVLWRLRGGMLRGIALPGMDWSTPFGWSGERSELVGRALWAAWERSTGLHVQDAERDYGETLEGLHIACLI